MGHDDQTKNGTQYLLIAITKPSELLLPCSIPDVEENRAEVRVELKRPHLDAHRGQIALLELARDVALDESCLADAAVADKNNLESGYVIRGGGHAVEFGWIGRAADWLWMELVGRI